MPRLLPTRPGVRLLLGVPLLLLLAQPGSAQDAGKPVKITTADHVTLTGTWYASSKKTEGVTILMLHAIGKDSREKGWQDLAKELQKKGYAVLTFDFRGHGGSTEVMPGMFNPMNPMLSQKGFWDEKDN